MTKARWRRYTLALILGMALIAAACGSDDSSSSSDAGTTDGDTTETTADDSSGEPADDSSGEPTGGAEAISVTFSNIAETPTLDPAIAFSSDGILFVRNVYDGLLEYAPGTSDLRPQLAESFEVSDDGLEYTFALIDGVTFHDGSDFDADDVVASIERIRTVNQGPATLMGNLDTVTAVDPRTVVITLKDPDPFFTGILPKMAIMSSDAIAANDDEWWATNEAGSGPYELVRWDRNQAIRLEAFTDYWRPFQAGTPTEVELRVDPDISTAMQLLEQGDIDMMGSVGPDEAQRARGTDGLTVVEQPSFEVKMLLMNVQKPPLDDVRVRKAIALAFDYEAMVDFFSGDATVPRGPLPSSLTGVGPELEPIAQNMDEARALLAEAGYPDGGFTLRFLGLKGLSYQEFAGNVLQEQLGKLGITVEQDLNPWPQMVEIQSNPETAADISFLNQSAFTNDPTFLLRSAYSSANTADQGGYNWSYYVNPEFDAKLDLVRTTTDEAERETLIGELQREIVDEFAAVYVVEPTLVQPVREGWDATYETIDYNYVVRFFYSSKL